MGTFNSLVLGADKAGCNFWRNLAPMWALQSVSKDIMCIDSMKFITDPEFFRTIRMVRLQRQVSDMQCHYFLKFLRPLADAIGFWIIYEIDDVISYDDIPKYNIGRHAFNTKSFYENIKNMLDASDIITVTTNELRDYYVKKYNISESKFKVIPNRPPRWWIGESYHVDDIMKRFKKTKRPRIGFPGSASHFDLELNNDGNDDYTHIIDFIIRNVDKYEFVFTGGYPMQVEKYVKSGKIIVDNGSDVLNYPRELYAKNFQAIIAPLEPNLFNECKSNIKLLEGWALGIPVFAQDIACYNKYTTDDFLFKDGDELEKKLSRLLTDKRFFQKTIKRNRQIMDTGNKLAPNGWWIEKNIQEWYDIFALPQKTLNISLKHLHENEGLVV